MGIIKRIFGKKETPSYVITVSGTPAGQTRTTTGGTISTPGSAAQPGMTGSTPPTNPSRYGGGSSGTLNIQQGSIQQALADAGVTSSENAKLTKEYVQQVMTKRQALSNAGRSSGSSYNSSPSLNNLGYNDNRNVNTRGGTSQQETYRPDLRGYTTQESMNRGGTTVIRQPTYEESIKIQDRENKLNQNVLTINSGTLQSNIQSVKKDTAFLSSTASDYEQQGTQITEFVKGKVDEGGYFVGTPAEYGTYQNMFQDYSELGNKRTRAYEDYQSKATIKTGFGTGKYSRDVSVMNFDLKTRPITGTLNIFGSTVGSVLGGVGESAGKEGGYFSDKARNVTIYSPQKGTVRSGVSGYSQLEIPSTAFGTPQQFRKGGELTGDIGVPLLAYASPIGTGLLLGQGAEVGADIYRTKKTTGSIPTSLLIEGAVLGTILVGGGIIKGAGIIKNNAIRSAVSKEIKLLEGTPIKSLTIIDEGAGIVSAVGERTVGTTTQSIKYTGRIMKTEKGFEFIPEGLGGNVVRGIVTPKIFGRSLKPRQFVSGNEFELGGKGKNIFLRNVGEAKMYEEVGVGTSIPKKDYFGITTLDKGKLTKQNIKELNKQLKKSYTPENVVYKNLVLPVGKDKTLGLRPQRNIYFQINENVGLRVNPQEVGTVIRIPKKTDVEVFGFQGGGQKSSSEFMQSLYNPKEQILFLPKLSSVKTNPNIVIPKTSNILETPSAYAGLNMYERTNEVSSPTLLNMQIREIPSTSISITSPTMVTTSTIPLRNPLVKEVPKYRGGTSSILNLETKPLEKVKQEDKIIQSFSQPQLSKQKVIQRQQQKFNQMQFQKLLSKPKVPTKLKVPIPFPLPSRSFVDRVRSGGTDIFKVYKKIKGKFSLVGEEKDLFKAERKLKSELLEDLSASGYVEKGGIKIKASEISDAFFKPSKRYVDILVQQKNVGSGRLSSFGERAEIKMFKKQSKGKKKRLSWFE